MPSCGQTGCGQTVLPDDLDTEAARRRFMEDGQRAMFRQDALDFQQHLFDQEVYRAGTTLPHARMTQKVATTFDPSRSTWVSGGHQFGPLNIVPQQHRRPEDLGLPAGEHHEADGDAGDLPNPPIPCRKLHAPECYELHPATQTCLGLPFCNLNHFPLGQLCPPPCMNYADCEIPTRDEIDAARELFDFGCLSPPDNYGDPNRGHPFVWGDMCNDGLKPAVLFTDSMAPYFHNNYYWQYQHEADFYAAAWHLLVKNIDIVTWIACLVQNVAAANPDPSAEDYGINLPLVLQRFFLQPQIGPDDHHYRTCVVLAGLWCEGSFEEDLPEGYDENCFANPWDQCPGAHSSGGGALCSRLRQRGVRWPQRNRAYKLMVERWANYHDHFNYNPPRRERVFCDLINMAATILHELVHAASGDGYPLDKVIAYGAGGRCSLAFEDNEPEDLADQSPGLHWCYSEPLMMTRAWQWAMTRRYYCASEVDTCRFDDHWFFRPRNPENVP